jgi:hypothetical protein
MSICPNCENVFYPIIINKINQTKLDIIHSIKNRQPSGVPNIPENAIHQQLLDEIDALKLKHAEEINSLRLEIESLKLDKDRVTKDAAPSAPTMVGSVVFSPTKLSPEKVFFPKRPTLWSDSPKDKEEVFALLNDRKALRH